MKKFCKIAAIVLTASVLLLITNISFAYFSKREIYNGMMGTQVEFLFDKLNDAALETYQANELPEGVTPDTTDPEWGTVQNPYIISNVKHLYNLAELQRLGYFYKNYISDNYNENGVYIEGSDSMPHFRVCTPDGTPVTIDGNTFGRDISAIGTEEFPFIGTVKGAFVDGSCTVEGKTSTSSAIYDVTVQGDPAHVDMGLFGYVSQLGTPGEEGTSFAGVVSEISNLMLYDVVVNVESSLWDKVTSFITDHIFAYSLLPEAEQDKVPHENHHIGILAGHISYTKAEYISVYYSADSDVAINLKDTTTVSGVEANYLSSSGILGYIDCMNPVIKDGNIVAGSGLSNEGISTGYIGGGCELSGDKAGYVYASDIYSRYHNYKLDGTVTDIGSDALLIRDAVAADGTPLCEEWVRERLLWIGEEKTGRYYFYDGVFTFALTGSGDGSDKSKDVIQDTWAPHEDKEFFIGPVGPENWVTNYSQGNNSVAAFLRPLLSDYDLTQAMQAGRKIFITYDRGSDFLLMNLSNQSSSDVDATGVTVEEKYTTDGIIQYFGNTSFHDSIVESFAGKQVPLDDTMIQVFGIRNASGELDVDATYNNIVSSLKGENDFYKDNHALKLINVGITSNDVSLEDLRNMYGITAQGVANQYAYYDYDTNSTLVTPNANGQIADYYDYSTSGYDGYFYYTADWTDWYSYYTYTVKWQPVKEGADTPPDTLFTYKNPNSIPSSLETVFGSPVATWANGEKVFEYTVGGKTYRGVAIDWSKKKFADTGSAASVNGASLTKAGTGNLNCYYTKIEENTEGVEKFYSCSTGAEVTLNDTGSVSASGSKIYTDASGNRGVKLIRQPYYEFSHAATANVMRLLMLNYGFQTDLGSSTPDVFYPLWNGVDSYLQASNFQHKFSTTGSNITPIDMSNSTSAAIKFNSDGTCYISYTIGDMKRYISYGSNGTDPAFVTAENYNDSCNLRIYSLEGTQSLNYGRVTFDPKGKTDADKYMVDEHLFFANSEKNNPSGKDEYTLVKIEDLLWQNGENGGILSGAELDKRFRMNKGLTFGETYTILGDEFPSEGIVQAPVGSLGIKANIPQGTIAFRVNNSGTERRIRVIVALPATIYCKGEAGYDEDKMNDYLHYFNLWQMKDVGSETVEIFRAEDAIDRFILPTSHGYLPGTEPSEAEYVTVRKGSVVHEENGKTTVSAGADTYACSLNGDRILVAYEFTVSDAGIYVLGASCYNAEKSEYVSTPMEIIYFSADGVASSGRDGNGGSQLGSIDFVYDYAEKIVTVTDGSSLGADGNEDYTKYYPSYVLLYFDNSLLKTSGGSDFIDINDARIHIRRWIDSSVTSGIASTCDFSVSSGNQDTVDKEYIKLVSYARLSDKIVNASLN